MYQILLDAAKAVLSKKFLDINNYIKKKKKQERPLQIYAQAWDCWVVGSSIF